jgi:hypothetical protein
MQPSKCTRNSGGRDACFFCNLFDSSHLFTSTTCISATDSAKILQDLQKYGKEAVIGNTCG